MMNLAYLPGKAILGNSLLIIKAGGTACDNLQHHWKTSLSLASTTDKNQQPLS